MTIRRLLAIALVALCSTTASAQSPCDPQYRPKGEMYGYKLRDGNRCEGEYESLVAREELALASFTRVFAEFNAGAVPFLRVRWATPADSAVSMQVRSVNNDIYYRMDTRLPRGSRDFRWPTDILRGRQLQQADLGALAWTSTRIRRKAVNLLIPLEISAAARPAPAGGYEMKVYPSLQLREVYVTLSQVDSTDRVLRVVAKSDSVQRGPYGPYEPIAIPIRNPGAKGLYRIDVKASTRGTRVLTMPPAYFYHPGA